MNGVSVSRQISRMVFVPADSKSAPSRPGASRREPRGTDCMIKSYHMLLSTIPRMRREESAVSAEEESAPTERMAADLSGLSDEEIEDYLREQVRADGRVDMDELKIVYGRGVLYLDGALPCEAQHQILLQYAAD